MTPPLWQELLLPRQHDDALWELFHENSKLGRHAHVLSDEDVRQRMARLYESLAYEGYPLIHLPQPQTSVPVSVTDAIANRASTRNMIPGSLSSETLATLLHYGYGVTRRDEAQMLPRAFRAAPSGGALYPLEIYIHSTHIIDVPPGLSHYDPLNNQLRLLREGDSSEMIAAAMVQPEIAATTSLCIFITALFERSTFKYGERGYRFVFLEAGHVAQNINLVATALGLGCVNLGGYFDRDVDRYLELDGVTHSTVYLIAIGEKSTSMNMEVPS